MVIFRSGGEVEQIELPGMPFGVMEDGVYEKVAVEIREGDSVLLFSDGVFEVHNAQGEMLGIAGLIGIVKSLGYPATAIEPEALEEELLKYSNAIRLDDDVTLIEMRM